MSNTETIESHHQYISMWKVLAGDRPGADLVDRAGLAMCWANSRFPFWNAIFLTESFADSNLLRQRLIEAASYMRGVSESRLVYVCEDFLSDSLKAQLNEVATSAELAFALGITGMTGDILPLAIANTPEPLTFGWVADETLLRTLRT